MRPFRLTSQLAALAVILVASSSSAFAAASEIKGAAILEHPCGKTSVKQMSLVHAGKMDQAILLGTTAMQDQWKAMSAEDKKMMGGMMKDMSTSDADYAAQLKAGGLLVIDGANATLTVKQEHKDANGSSTETMTQQLLIDAKGCWISH
ncbi:MAG: hypothetical protein ABI639_13280 [Thermoanaerobaculia bacterium]